jgi:hypothetical protein
MTYPLWSTNQLAGSPAEQMTRAFLRVPLSIVAMPWAYGVQDLRLALEEEQMIPIADAQATRFLPGDFAHGCGVSLGACRPLVGLRLPKCEHRNRFGTAAAMP